jgi:hypothetical protein
MHSMFLPGGETMLVRLAGPGKALEVLAKEIGGEIIDNAIWDEIRETPLELQIRPHAGSDRRIHRPRM